MTGEVPIDPQMRRLMMMMISRGGAVPQNAEERRAGFRSLMRLAKPEGLAPRVEERGVPIQGGTVPLRIYRPAREPSGPLPGLVYLHGGGMVAGGLDTHDALCSTLCDLVGCGLVAVDYRLAPEHPFPSAIEDCYAATRWSLGEAPALGLDPARIAIGGDSAGGTLAAVVAQMLRHAPGPALHAQFLLCPVLDAQSATASRRAFGQGYLLDEALMRRDLDDYLQRHEDPGDPRVSPLRATDVAGLPPAFIHTAEFDPLRDEGQAYAARLAAAGVPVRYSCHAGMVHHFYGFAALVPQARIALHAIADEMRAVLG